jgi:hypothetical protein
VVHRRFRVFANMWAMPHLLNAFGESTVVPSDVGSRYTF